MEIVGAVVREDGGTPSIETLDLAEPRESEILVRLVATGVCHTDLKARALSQYAPKPVVLGHEGAGIIERVGSAVRAVAPGDHVVMTYDSCAICPSCVENEPAYCYQSRARNFGCTRPDGSTTLSANGVPVHGSFFGQSSFATFALGTERNVVKVRKDAPLELLGPLGCGIQTATSSSKTAPRTSSSPEAKTSVRSKSRMCFTSIPMCWKPQSCTGTPRRVRTPAWSAYPGPRLLAP